MSRAALTAAVIALMALNLWQWYDLRERMDYRAAWAQTLHDQIKSAGEAYREFVEFRRAVDERLGRTAEAEGKLIGELRLDLWQLRGRVEYLEEFHPTPAPGPPPPQGQMAPR